MIDTVMKSLRETAHSSLVSGPWLQGSVPASFDSDVTGMPDNYGQARIVAGRVCRALLDGPLSDPDILEHIPEVQNLINTCRQFAGLIYLYGDKQLFRNMTTEEKEAYEMYTKEWQDLTNSEQ